MEEFWIADVEVGVGRLVEDTLLVVGVAEWVLVLLQFLSQQDTLIS